MESHSLLQKVFKIARVLLGALFFSFCIIILSKRYTHKSKRSCTPAPLMILHANVNVYKWAAE